MSCLRWTTTGRSKWVWANSICTTRALASFWWLESMKASAPKRSITIRPGFAYRTRTLTRRWTIPSSSRSSCQMVSKISQTLLKKTLKTKASCFILLVGFIAIWWSLTRMTKSHSPTQSGSMKNSTNASLQHDSQTWLNPFRSCTAAQGLKLLISSAELNGQKKSWFVLLKKSDKPNWQRLPRKMKKEALKRSPLAKKRKRNKKRLRSLRKSLSRNQLKSGSLILLTPRTLEKPCAKRFQDRLRLDQSTWKALTAISSIWRQLMKWSSNIWSRHQSLPNRRSVCTGTIFWRRAAHWSEVRRCWSMLVSWITCRWRLCIQL